MAIRYYVTEAGPDGSQSDYFGIDTFVISVGTPAYSVGGSVSGLNGGVVLWLNGADRLSVDEDGNFQFPRMLDTGTTYSVRIYEHPSGQVCTIANATGSIGAADIDSVLVTCSPD